MKELRGVAKTFYILSDITESDFVYNDLSLGTDIVQAKQFPSYQKASELGAALMECLETKLYPVQVKVTYEFIR